MNERTEPKSLTIVLSNRAPVRSLEVRRHEDCRTIVYGEEYLAGSSDPGYSGSQAGELVPAVDPIEEQDRLIATKIIEVGKSLGFADYFIQECIASMAPEELD
jgi:hypothetical protein